MRGMIIRGDGDASVLEPPHRMPLLGRPELQGQTRLAQAAGRYLADRLPGRDALAPALWRRGPRTQTAQNSWRTVFPWDERNTLQWAYER